MADYRCFGVRSAGTATIVDITNKALTELLFQEQLRDELLDLVATTVPIQLVINMARVEMIGSQAIGALIDVRKVVLQDGGQLAFCGVELNVHASFQVLNLEGTLFNVFDSESAALKSLD